MINIVWTLFIIIGIIYSIIFGSINDVNNSIMSSAKESLDVFLSICPNLILWTGIMNILVESKLISKISKIFYPIFKKIFTGINSNDDTLGLISISFLMNILGLSNASTAFSIKAIKMLNKKDTITFLVLLVSTSSVIPTTVLSLRNSFNSVNSSVVVLPIIISGTITMIIALLLNKIIGSLHE